MAWHRGLPRHSWGDAYSNHRLRHRFGTKYDCRPASRLRALWLWEQDDRREDGLPFVEFDAWLHERMRASEGQDRREVATLLHSRGALGSKGIGEVVNARWGRRSEAQQVGGEGGDGR